MRLQIPAVLRDVKVPFIWCSASKEGYSQYDEDWAVSPETWGPAELSVASRTTRRIVLEADVDATIIAFMADALPTPYTGLFSFQPETFYRTAASGYTHTGENVYARCRLVNSQIGPVLLRESPYTVPSSVVDPAAGRPGIPSGANFVMTPGALTFTSSSATPPWGTMVLLEIKVEKARWGYWMIDFLEVTLPDSPV